MLLERLESRRLCTVTVAQGYPGFYEIYGDDNDNEISIDVSPDSQSFTLDGQTYGGVQQLTVYGFGGNDLIMVTAPRASSISATINGGEGDDQIALNFDGAVRGNSGNDRIFLYDSFRGEAYGGSGDDYIWISGDNVDANIDGGPGDDWIDASSNNFGVFIHGGDGNDTIFGSNYDDHLFGDAGNNVIYGLGGRDTISIRNGSYDFADGGGDVGDTCFCDSNDQFQDSVSGFENVFYG